MPSNRKSAFFKAVGEAQEQGTEPHKLTLPDRKVSSIPPERQELENVGTQETEGLGTQLVDKGTQVLRNPGTKDTKGLGTQGIVSSNAKSSSAQYSRLGVYVPVDLHRRLKIYAALVGREMSDIAIEAFLEYLARNE